MGFVPYPLVRYGIRRLNQQGRVAIMYLHPWELDPSQPRVTAASWLAKFRHYHGIERVEAKLNRLLADFRFGSIRDVFYSSKTGRYELLPPKE